MACSWTASRTAWWPCGDGPLSAGSLSTRVPRVIGVTGVGVALPLACWEKRRALHIPPMKVALELKIFFSTPKSPFGLTSIFRGRLPVRLVLALLHTCTNGNNGSVLLLHLPTLLHIAAWTSAPKWLAGRIKNWAKGLCISTSLTSHTQGSKAIFLLQTRRLWGS